MNRKNNKLLECTGDRFGPSVLASIEAEDVVLTEVDMDAFPKFKTNKEETDHVATLNQWGKKVQKQYDDDYFKFSRFIEHNLATVCGVLLSLCDDGLKIRSGIESDFQEIIRNKRYCVMKLHHIFKKICLGSIGVEVEDMLENFLQDLYVMFFISSDEYSGLPKCLEESDIQHAIMEETLFDVANERLKDA